MRIFQLPLLFRLFYPGAIFRLGSTANTVYLTFDDGPNRGVTEKILTVLNNEKVKATFFSSGSSAEKHPELVELIRSEGYSMANHGYNHIKGWSTDNKSYIENVKRGFLVSGSRLFRPPFGSLGFRQFYLLRRDFKILFWDLILYDFDPTFRHEDILRVLKKKLRPGSIIVLHDNPGSSSPDNLSNIISLIKDLGYKIGDLETDLVKRERF